MACPEFTEYAKIALLLLIESGVVLYVVESEQIWMVSAGMWISMLQVMRCRYLTTAVYRESG